LNRIIDNELPLGKILDWVDEEYQEPLAELYDQYDHYTEELQKLEVAVGDYVDEVAVGEPLDLHEEKKCCKRSS
jgi:hypothetical protein